MSTFTLKIIALILMVIDHIGLYFPNAPLLLRLLGRISYPLFLFCMVWGYHYTKNRKRYLIRLYGLSIFMTVLINWIDNTYPTETGFGYHNIFLSMLLVGVLISTIETFMKDRKKGYLMLGGIMGVQLLYYLLPMAFPVLRSFSGDTLSGFIPNLYLNEYGFPFVALGVLLYFLKDKKELFCAAYIVFCIAQFSAEMLDAGMPMQCFMILALPLMLRYNNQKGHSMKYFFYIFYPAHAILLFYLANFVLVK